MGPKKTITKWISKTIRKKKNLLADIPTKQLSEKLINDRYALVFDGAVEYYSTELGLFQVDPGNCFDFLCMTFRTISDAKDQVLSSTFQVEQNPYTKKD